MFFRKKAKQAELAKQAEAAEVNARIVTKIKYLFDTYKDVDDEKRSYKELKRLTEIEVNEQWLSELAEGKIATPKFKFLTKISSLFGIDHSFWVMNLEEWIDRQNNPRSSRMLVRTRQGCVPLKELPSQVQQQMIEISDDLEKKIIAERAAKKE
jgi:transcriptional regulator with XRE-family HTH domain